MTYRDDFPKPGQADEWDRRRWWDEQTAISRCVIAHRHEQNPQDCAWMEIMNDQDIIRARCARCGWTLLSTRAGVELVPSVVKKCAADHAALHAEHGDNVCVQCHEQPAPSLAHLCEFCEDKEYEYRQDAEEAARMREEEADEPEEDDEP
jgi:hypothetical protein